MKNNFLHERLEVQEGTKMQKRSGLKEKAMEVRKKILLLIGENPDIALFTALQQEGYEVVCCESPQRAWGLVWPVRPHFIIVHLRQPGRRDIATLQECRALAEGVPVIVAMSEPGYETVMKALEERATAFLFLPIKPQAIRKALDGLQPSINKKKPTSYGGFKMIKKADEALDLFKKK